MCILAIRTIIRYAASKSYCVCVMEALRSRSCIQQTLWSKLNQLCCAQGQHFSVSILLKLHGDFIGRFWYSYCSLLDILKISIHISLWSSSVVVILYDSCIRPNPLKPTERGEGRLRAAFVKIDPRLINLSEENVTFASVVEPFDAKCRERRIMYLNPEFH